MAIRLQVAPSPALNAAPRRRSASPALTRAAFARTAFSRSASEHGASSPQPSRRTPLLLAMLALSTTAPLYAEAPISIINTTNLTFGAFAANNGGTISVSSSGMASTSGTVLRPSSSSSAAAAFSVSGEPDFVFAITLPSNGEAALSGTGGTMTLDGFVDSASGLGQLSPGGTQTLTVGATLNVGSSQQPGTYTGSFSVVVEYN